MVELHNYSTSMIKDWNVFESSDMSLLEGDTIFVSKPNESENNDSEYLRTLLDKKIQEQKPDYA